MAYVEITRRWPDGDVLCIHVKAGASYPDELSEARATAIAAYREALGISVADTEDTQ